ncbi:hypothetical protein CIK52_01610 [Kocuria rosea]|uniref:hypothetical protein n=1 Tax=Kocuria rosea TaxID=1275 RepID=UPI000D65992C|nr:hypothetical protein [Kocuria rosea]PWF88021.1 hypothetical protein CIK52_01610 [Kocuria rosea]QCY32637.1 hypothetical protein EQG70_06860 [Kocuria rosea]TQN34689.1 hypothetical protein FHX38_2793 [Kocuria rosea]
MSQNPPQGPPPQGPQYNQQPGPYQGQPGPYQGQPGQYQQPPQKKGKKKWVIGCLGLIVLALVFFGGCAALVSGGASETSTSSSNSDAEPSEVQTEDVENAGTVTFEATASTTGTVIWGNLDGSTNTEDFTGTWTKEVTPKESSELYNVTVTGDFMDDSSEVTCKLYVDGELKDEATGTGSAGSASCTQPMFG